MNIFLYDKTFEGFLSAIFYAYDTKIFPNKIAGSDIYQSDMFAEKFSIYTNSEIAKRVWSGIEKKSSKRNCQNIYRAFLSELPDIEMLLFKYIQQCFDSPVNLEGNYADKHFVEFDSVCKKVGMEAQRAIMFIRFQKTAEGMYYAPFEPLYNVLPLTLKHFKDRFSDQQWVIYDTKRNYGYHYDLKEVNEIRISDSAINPFSGKISKESLDTAELDFQELWNDYYKSINIKERKNPKVHKQFLPKRFWKYLPEKNFIPELGNQNINVKAS